jgi:hypothetical protein
MANPNIISATTLTGKSKVVNLTTTNNTGIVTNSASSNLVYRVTCIRATNYDGANPADITVSIYDSSENVTGYLAYTIAVAADTTFNIIDKTETVYLEEGDYISANSSAANDLSIYCSYEEIG